MESAIPQPSDFAYAILPRDFWSGAYGGGISNYWGSPLTITNTTISNNTASDYGGGIFSWDTLDEMITLTNVTISDNNATQGGGLAATGTVTATDSQILRNTATLAGGGVNYAGQVTLIRTTVADNQAGNSGGGLNDSTSGSYATLLTLSDSEVSGNTAGWHGGGLHSHRPVSIRNSTISQNHAELDGGGIHHLYHTAGLSIDSSTVAGNTAGRDGGGVFTYEYSNDPGGSSFTNSTVSGNTANHDGGGIYHRNVSGLTLTNITVSGNHAINVGGGIYNNHSTEGLSLVNNTVSENLADVQGGGVYNVSPLSLANTIIAANTSPDGPEGFGSSGITSLGYNLIGDDSSFSFTHAAGDQVGTPALLEPLADNGGPTLTHALSAGSPALDAGGNTLAAGIDFDQRGSGFPRIIDGDGDGTATIDIGAFESELLNQAPVADDDAYLMYGDSLTVEALGLPPGVLDNDSHDDNDPLTAVLDDLPIEGTVTLNSDGSFIYTVGAGFDGSDSFTYHASDGMTDSNVATVTITHQLYVTNTNDSGEGSLRWTIDNANTHPNDSGPDIIRFAIDTGLQTIRPNSALPGITDPVFLDAATQPGFAGTPIVELDGSLTPGGDGLHITASNSTIRGLVVNRFSGDGIEITGNGAVGNVLIGNFIGLNAAGTAALGNAENGVHIDNGARNNRIGTDGDGVNDVEERNVISGNIRANISISDADANIVAGNFIGTNAAGTAAVANGGHGVHIDGGAASNRIGTDGSDDDPFNFNANERNIISGQPGSGVFLTQTADNVIAGNYVGLDASGTEIIGNGWWGIIVHVDSRDNRVGTNADGIADTEEANVVTGNRDGGIVIGNALSGLVGSEHAATGNVVAGNLIGTDATGRKTFGSGQTAAGILIVDPAVDNRIGGILPAERNVVSGNMGSGIGVVGLYGPSLPDANVIQGNYVGSDITGTVSLGNVGHGVVIYNATNTLVGGEMPGAGNLIVGNGGAGIGVAGAAATGNTARCNSIHSNGGLGIDLVGDDVTPNDPGDVDTGPNGLQNFPVLSLAEPGVTDTHIVGTLNSLAETTFTLDFYANTVADPSGYGEGERYLGTIDVTTGADGNVSFDVSLAAATTLSEYLTATATDPDGSTSEFSAVQIVNTLPTPDAGGLYGILEGQALTLDASGSSDPDGDPLTFAWDIDGDGEFDDAVGPNPVITWQELTELGIDDDGTYPLSVRVEDDKGGVAEASVDLTVENTAPIIDVTGASTVDEGSPYTLTLGAVTDPGDDTVAQYVVNWGDGNSDTYTAAGDVPHTYVDGLTNPTITVDLVDEDGTHTGAGNLTVTVNNVAPTADDASFDVIENATNGTPVGEVTANDPGIDALTYTITGGTGATALAIDPATGEITVADSTQLDYETRPSLSLEVTVTDDDGATDTAIVTINLLNQASITGTVFVDTNQNGLYEANEMGIDGVIVELLDELGQPVLDETGEAVTATTSDGGFYLFEDLAPGTYQIHEQQPTGVDDGAEQLGTIDGIIAGSVVADDTMQLTLARRDASDYVFAEIGQQVASGDTAGIGFWQNKHGQNLIRQGGTALADWLTANFANIFGDSLEDADGDDVASFYKDQLFKQKGKKTAGPAKVDAQFMAVALASYFTSSNLAGFSGSDYGFNVTDTGIGTKIVNVGANGTAFGVVNDTELTIMQLLWATDNLTDIPDGQSGFAHIYDQDGDGVIDSAEAALRAMANDVYSMLNEQGDE